MGGLQKSKRITWAPDVNLCQVKLFSSAKPPSEVGMGRQHRLQVKASWPVEPDMPPGFEKTMNLKLPRIPLSRWRCPARIELNSKWLVVAGEESKEIKAMYERERRVLEAVYPQPSAIPPNPRLPMNAPESIGDDHNIPLIPIIPIEESDPMGIPQPQNEVVSSQSDGNSMVEAAKAALASVLSNTPNQDQRNLIDPDLLIRILTNPNLLQHLLIATKQQPATQNIPNSKLQPRISSDSTSIPINGEASLPTPITMTELNAPPTTTAAAPFHQPPFTKTELSAPPTTTAAAPFHQPPFTKPELNAPPTTTTAAPFHQPPFTKPELIAPPATTAAAPCHQPRHGTGFASTSVPSPPVVKDVNYFKSLIQQHGGGGGVLPQSCSQSNRLMGGTTQELRKPRDSMKSRIMKPCIYFNSNRGCKNGANCAYQHDVFSSQKRVFCATEVLAAKRIKLAR